MCGMNIFALDGMHYHDASAKVKKICNKKSFLHKKVQFLHFVATQFQVATI